MIGSCCNKRSNLSVDFRAVDVSRCRRFGSEWDSLIGTDPLE